MKQSNLNGHALVEQSQTQFQYASETKPNPTLPGLLAPFPPLLQYASVLQGNTRAWICYFFKFFYFLKIFLY